MTDQLSLLPMLNELHEGNQGTIEALQESVRQNRKGDKVMKCDEMKPLVFSLKDLAYIDEPAVEKNFGNPHDHAVYKATEVDAAIAELKRENRKLKRALWLARAGEASKEVNYWNCENESSYAIVDFNVHHETIVSYKAPHHRPYKWILIWEEVESKCRAKAEQYK